MRLIIAFIFLFSQSLLFGQSQIISGRLISEETKESVPYANVYIEGSTVGTVTNEQGRFRLYIPQELQGTKIVFSSIGYKRKLLEAEAQKEWVVFLEPSKIALDEVIVTPKDYARKILLAAINNIPVNYSDEDTSLETFMRSGAYADSSKNDCFYILEALLNVEQNAYHRKFNTEYIELIQERKYEFQYYTTLPFNFYGIAHVVYDADLVNSRTGPLSIKKIEDYELTILDTLSFESKRLFQIGYKPQSGGKGSGSVFVEEGTYVITKMTMFLTNKEIGGLIGDIGLSMRNLSRGYQEYEVEYRSNGADKWILSHASFSTAFMEDDSIKIFADADFVVTSVNEVKPKDSQSNQNKLGYSDVLMANEYSYDSTFWEGYNVTLPSNKVDQIIANTPLRSSGKTILEKVTPILSKLRVTYSFGIYYGRLSSAAISSTSSPSFSGQFRGRKFECAVLSSGIGYDFIRGISIDYLVASSIESRAFIERSFRLSKSIFPENSRSAVSIFPSLAIGWQQWNNEIGEIHSDQDFEYGGKTFDSEKVNAFYSSRGLSVTPALRISVSNHKRMHFFLESGYSFLSRARGGLLLKEGEGLFKKNVFVASGSELSIESEDSDLISNNWNLNIGFFLDF